MPCPMVGGVVDIEAACSPYVAPPSYLPSQWEAVTLGLHQAARHQSDKDLPGGPWAHLNIGFSCLLRVGETSCLWNLTLLPTHGSPSNAPPRHSPAGLLALEILTGGKLHLLSFGRTDMSHTLATSSRQEVWFRPLGILRQETWEGLRDAEGQWTVALTQVG